MSKYILALDQGTTSSRSILYDLFGRELSSSSKELPIYFPNDGWVEQDALDIWETQLATVKEVTQGIDSGDVKAIGIANQRETLIVWDPKDGAPLAPAVVWQCRRSSDVCARLRADGVSDYIRNTTGLVLDPYFSGTKILWLLENIDGLRKKVREGKAVFGTVDSWLVYNLTKGQNPKFITEPSNASRTMLFSLKTGDWDDRLLEIFSIKRENLPALGPSFGLLGETSVLGGVKSVPICGILGDQQSALLGHGCDERGSGKCTFGTGAFMLVNTDSEIVLSDDGLLSTVAWQISEPSLCYAVEGSVFMAGALVGWLKNNLGIISDYNEIEPRARAVKNSAGVVIVPAFVGLGAPYWDETARGLIIGLHRDVTANHIIRASLEAVAHQVADLLTCSGVSETTQINIDGGMSTNKLFCQILSDICQLKVHVSDRTEMTAFGAFKAAGLGVGLFDSLAKASLDVSDDNGQKSEYVPSISRDMAIGIHLNWKEAVARSRGWLN